MSDNSFNSALIDFITHSPDKKEFAFYLVESPPWDDVEERVKKMQSRIYTTLDAILDGIIASDYPDSKGKALRIEVVCKGVSPPARFQEVTERINNIANSEGDYARDIKNSAFLSSLVIAYSEE
jgi:hypothetical protein